MNRPNVVVPMLVIGVFVLICLFVGWMNRTTEPDYILTCPTDKLEECVKNFKENSTEYEIKRLLKQDDADTVYIVGRK